MNHILVVKDRVTKNVHVRTALTEGTREVDFYLPLTSKSEQYLKNLSDIGQKLVRGVASIEGVTSVRVDLYSIKVIVAPLFDWDTEISHQVISVVKDACYPHQEVSITEMTFDEFKAAS
tara:strand:- start:6673 stop:7029 length:357 start_codon:yes stop_codon:yes gene_type:complete